jgi:hypothetical protein
MATYSDNFNRASLGTDWTNINSGTWSIESSTYLTQTASVEAYRGLRYNSVLDSDNVDVSISAYSTDGGGAGILVRAPNSGTESTDLDGYAIVFFPNDTFYLLRFDNGNDTGVGYSYTYGSPVENTYYTLRITVQDSTVTGYINGTQRFQFTDTTYSGNGNRSVVVLGFNNTERYDDFSAQDIVSAQTINPTLFSNTNTFYNPVVSNVGSSQNVLPSFLENEESLYNPTFISSQIVNLFPANRNNYSVRFNGNGADVNRIRIPLENGTDTQYPVNVGAGDFTVESWIKALYSENTTASLDEDARYSNIFYDRDSWGEQRGHVIGVTRSGANLVVTFGQAGSGGTWTSISTTSNIGDNEWHHIAVTRNQSTGLVRIFVDGVQEASGTYDTGDWSFPAGHTVASGQDNQNLILGCEKHDVGYYFTGELDELRISDVVKYNSTFTPSRHLTVDENSAALFRFDEGTGTSVNCSADVGNVAGIMLVGGSPAGPIWNAVELVGSELFSISVTYAASILPDLLVTENSFFSPTITTGSVSAAFSRIESTSELFSISANVQGVQISPQLLENSQSFSDFSVARGTVTANLTRIENSSQTFQPLVSAAGNTVLLTEIVSTSQVFNPNVLRGIVTVNTTRLESIAQFFTPKLDLNVQSVRIESTQQLFQPAITTGAVSIETSTIESSSQVFPVLVSSRLVLVPTEINPTSQVFNPVISTGSVSVQIIRLENTNNLFSFNTGSGTTIEPVLLTTGQIFNPTFTPGSVTIIASHKTSENQFYDMLISSETIVSPDFIDSTSTTFVISATQNVGLELLENVEELFQFTIDSQNSIVIDLLENQNTFFNVSISTGSVLVEPSTISETQIFNPVFYLGSDKIVDLEILENTNVFFTGTLARISPERIIRTGVQNRIIIVQ